MDWRVTFSARSKSDLQKIVEYISRDDSKAALRFGLRLIEHAESLAGVPEIGVPVQERPGTRFLPHGQYLIIYRTDAPTRTIRILRFWHGARRRRPLH